MRVPLSWLLEYAAVDPGTDAAEVARRLTAAGLEVESVERVGYEISGVIVAEVAEIEELTEFRKPIRYVRVNTGSGEQHVICGAVNFAVGDRVPLARPGSVLPGGFEIGARRAYGRMSEGMICSPAELGIGDDHTGILVLPPPTSPAPSSSAGRGLRGVRGPARSRARHQRDPGQGLRAVGARRWRASSRSRSRRSSPTPRTPACPRT